MLNQPFTSAAIAADRRRELLAEAEAYRLARAATQPAEQADRPARRFTLVPRWTSRAREAT